MAATQFKGVALEVGFFSMRMDPQRMNVVRPKLGGKDPAYVRSDADLAYTVAELVDGEEDSMFSLVAIFSPVFQVHSSILARVAARSRLELSDFYIHVAF